MKIERAIEILDPAHHEIYDSVDTVMTARRMGMDALRRDIPCKPRDVHVRGLGGQRQALVEDDVP